VCTGARNVSLAARTYGSHVNQVEISLVIRDEEYKGGLKSALYVKD
jgi:hypothetical protein